MCHFISGARRGWLPPICNLRGMSMSTSLPSVSSEREHGTVVPPLGGVEFVTEESAALSQALSFVSL